VLWLVKKTTLKLSTCCSLLNVSDLALECTRLGKIRAHRNPRERVDTIQHALDTNTEFANQGGLELDGDVNTRLFITGESKSTTEILPQISYLSDLELQCTTEGLDFPALDTVRLAISGLSTGEEVWLLEKDTGDTWKQTRPIEL